MTFDLVNRTNAYTLQVDRIGGYLLTRNRDRAELYLQPGDDANLMHRNIVQGEQSHPDPAAFDSYFDRLCDTYDQILDDMRPVDPLAHLERAAAEQRAIHGPALYQALQDIAAADERGDLAVEPQTAPDWRKLPANPVLAPITLRGLTLALQALERIPAGELSKADAKAIDEVICALQALENDTDAIVLDLNPNA